MCLYSTHTIYIYYKDIIVITMSYKVLGTSKISKQNKITIIEPALKTLDVCTGDLLVYYEDENKNIMIKGSKHGGVALSP